MSFDLFVTPLPGSTWGNAERQQIVDILYRDGGETDRAWSVRYPDGSGAREIYGIDDWEPDDERTRGLCFSRFGGRTFADRLYELVDQLDAMVFWPGIAPMVAVTRQDRLERLPFELAPNEKVVVSDADDLVAHICK